MQHSLNAPGLRNLVISRWRLLSLVALAVLVLTLASVACSDDDEDEDPAGSSLQAQAETESDESPREQSERPEGPVVGSGTAQLRRGAGGEPRIVNEVDVVFNDLTNGRMVFELDAEPLYGADPQGMIIPLVEGADLEANILANLQWLADQGYDSLHLFIVDGFGGLLLASTALTDLRHPGFDYDAQYDGDPEEDELKVDEVDARQRFYVGADVLPLVAREAHALGLTVEVNIEPLAHIINRAEGSGIGAEEDALVIAGNLPPPTVDQVLAFLDDAIAAGADRVFAEAFSVEYDTAIAAHLEAKGVPYLHAGPDLGSVWIGYHYALYPDDPRAETAYGYQYTIDALLGTTNATIFARARARPERPETAVVVGAYLPVPCDTRLSIADLYSETRSDREAYFIDNEFPALPDGSAVENCATDTWLNLLLIATRRQGVDTLRLTSDVVPSIEATMQPGLGTAIRERLASHPAPEGALPVANIVLDIPTFGPEDGFTNVDFFEIASLTTLGLVDDALSAAGYLTVLTYDRPWTGGDVALTYIVTAGGNEDTGEGIGMGPPYWSDAQELEPDLVALLDPAAHAGPVFLHPLLGIPDSGNWRGIRARFGLPERFSYRNTALSGFEEYHTSLLTSVVVDDSGDTPEGSAPLAVTPERGAVLGEIVQLTPFLEVLDVGQVASYLLPGDYDVANVFAAGPLVVPSTDGARTDEDAPYLLQGGAGRYLWTVNNLHHEAFTYLVVQAIASATGTPPVLAKPAKAHVWSGRQTFAYAYDATELVLNLPFNEGELVDVTVYDIRSQPVREERAVPYRAPLRVSLDKYSLLVVEPAR